ncbi:MAG: ThuA domain-containing protein [Planctomycetota bacterium]|nr:ThuA domain-containing protein [Planctomycetota bacterium]MDA1180341.1 ThuA domain-containing protein [Planctomycetota bacterium]
MHITRSVALTLIVALFCGAGHLLAAPKRIVFVAGPASHDYGTHEHFAGCTLLAKWLHENMGYQCDVVRNGYPQDDAVFDGADAIVVYCDGGDKHVLNPHLQRIGHLADQGVGLGCIHYGVEVPKGEVGDHFLKWIGGHFETHWSVNPHWKAEFRSFPDHPVARGVKPFSIDDEWYYHMRFRPKMSGVTPILSAHPPESTLKRANGPHSGNPAVRAAVARHEIQHVAWVSERPDGGRGFGFTGGHFHWNWGDQNFRKVVLNAIVWLARDEVPTAGVETQTVSTAQLEENQDEPKP